jgi:hypothetical protein
MPMQSRKETHSAVSAWSPLKLVTALLHGRSTGHRQRGAARKDVRQRLCRENTGIYDKAPYEGQNEAILTILSIEASPHGVMRRHSAVRARTPFRRLNPRPGPAFVKQVGASPPEPQDTPWSVSLCVSVP